MREVPVRSCSRYSSANRVNALIEGSLIGYSTAVPISGSKPICGSFRCVLIRYSSANRGNALIGRFLIGYSTAILFIEMLEPLALSAEQESPREISKWKLQVMIVDKSHFWILQRSCYQRRGISKIWTGLTSGAPYLRSSWRWSSPCWWV
jgi:hypothetical protein